MVPCAATLLCALAILPFLGKRSFWFDEGISVAFASLSPHDLWQAIHHTDATLATYYLLLHVWGVSGKSDAAIRLLSACAAIGTVPVGYVLARRLVGERAAAGGALLIAVLPFLVADGSEARPYALVYCGLTGAAYFLVRSVERPTARNFAAYVILAVVSLYLHALAGFVLIAYALSLPLLRVARADAWKWLVALATIACLALPVAWGLRLGRDADQISWIPPPHLHDIWTVLGSLSGSGIAALVFLALAGVALVQAEPRRNVVALALWFALPIAFAFAVSVLVQPLFLARYLIGTTVPLAILAGAGLSRLPSVPLRAAATAAFVALLLFTDLRHAPSEDVRAAVAYVERTAGSAAGIAAYPPGLVYAVKQEAPHAAATRIAYPSPAWTFWSKTSHDTTGPYSGRVVQYATVDVIVRHAYTNTPTFDGWLARAMPRYRVTAMQHFVGLDVIELRRAARRGAPRRLHRAS